MYSQNNETGVLEDLMAGRLLENVLKILRILHFGVDISVNFLKKRQKFCKFILLPSPGGIKVSEKKYTVKRTIYHERCVQLDKLIVTNTF